uniref:Uncharacterized protein n=1 Tax=Phlebotomus papatasi TaxID=29031 RepID=A0A1B0DAN5_PHLPP
MLCGTLIRKATFTKSSSHSNLVIHVKQHCIVSRSWELELDWSPMSVLSRVL